MVERKFVSVLWGPSVAVTEGGAREFSEVAFKEVNPIHEGSTLATSSPSLKTVPLNTIALRLGLQHEHMGLGEINSIQQLCTIALIIN